MRGTAGNAALVMQGGACGESLVATSTASSWPIAYAVVGATSPTQVFFSNCLTGNCNLGGNILPAAVANVTPIIGNYGTSVVRNGNIVTLNLGTSGGNTNSFPPGSTMIVSGATPSDLNGTFTVATNTLDSMNPVMTWAQVGANESATGTLSISAPQLSVTFYPSAFITGTNNGVSGNVQLGSNQVPFAMGDTVVGAPTSQFQNAGLNVYIGQTTPVSGGNASGGVNVVDEGPADLYWAFSAANKIANGAAPEAFNINGSYDSVFRIGYRPAYNGALLYVQGGEPVSANAKPYYIFEDNLAGGGWLRFSPVGGSFSFGGPVIAPSIAATVSASAFASGTTIGGILPCLQNGTNCPAGSGAAGVTSVATGAWPSWLSPSVTNATTTPSVAVVASAIPNAALANSSTTVNGTSCALGGSCTIATGSSTPPLTYTYFPAAVSDGGVAFAAAFTRYNRNEPAAGSVASASSALGYLLFQALPSQPQYAELTMTAPPYWTSTAIYFNFYSSATAGNAVLDVQTACVTPGQVMGSPTFSTAMVTSTAVSSTANGMVRTALISGIATPGLNGCPATGMTTPTYADDPCLCGRDIGCSRVFHGCDVGDRTEPIMRKIFLSAILLLAAAFSFGQATNPQNTFSAAEWNGGISPSLAMNFDDSTTAFKDVVSGTTMVTSQTLVPALESYGNNTVSASTTTTSCSVNSSAPGSFILVFYTGTPVSTVDSLGSTFVVVGSGIGYFNNVSTGTHVITETFSPAMAFPVMYCSEWFGVSSTSPIDVYGTNTITGANTSFTSGPITTTDPGDILVGMQYGGNATFTLTAPVFTAIPHSAWTGIFSAQYFPGATGTYAFTGTQSNSATATTTVVALKPKINSSDTISVNQPGFDNTNNSNYSAKFLYDSWSSAPNNTFGSTMEWNTPWTMMLHVDRLNWNKSSTLVLASKGDLSGQNNFWELYIQQNAGSVNASQLCFKRAGAAPYTQIVGPIFYASQTDCTPAIIDLVPNLLNYNIIIEDSGTGSKDAIGMWVNGIKQSLAYYAISGRGFGGVTIAITNGGTGYTSAPTIGSTGGGANCTISGTTATVSGGAINSVSVYGSGCTSAPTITITGGGGSGAVLTATAYPMTMNSPTAPLMVPGYVNNKTFYGPGGTDTTQNPLYVDEFAEFAGNLSIQQIANLFYTTKFYQNLLYPGLAANPPLVIMNNYGCGPDFSGDQTIAMLIGAAKAGLIRLIGFDDDDPQPDGSNSAGWYRQMLDQAGLADVPLSVGTNVYGPNLGGCPAATITAYNANTPQNASAYQSPTTMFRTLFAKYSTQPIYVMQTQTATGYNNFQLSAADGISSLTGLQLQAQNYANGGWVNMFEGNFGTSPAAYLSLLNNIGNYPIYFEGGSPSNGGPGIYASRTANDPLYLVASNMLSDYVTGWTNLNVVQLISPYFQGGALITVSGGTGYANQTKFVSIGGGPTCNVTGIMTASGGVPSGTLSGSGMSVGTSYDGIGYGCTPIVFTATGSGTNLTVSAITCCNVGPINITPPLITIGDTISGTGIPACTTIVSQTSGAPGGIGVYVTSAATTASSATVTRQPTIVLTAPTGTGVTLTPAVGIFPKYYEGSGTASYAVYPNRWSVQDGLLPFTWFQNSLIDLPSVGSPRAY